jgi:hypothetical protein
MRIVAIDPGKRKIGIAIFEGRDLVEAQTIHPRSYAVGRARISALAADWRADLVSELPVVLHNRADAREDVEDLIEWVRALEPKPIALYQPTRWKGQVPKPVHHERIRIALAGANWGVRCPLPPAEEHDAWDAVGIGMYHINLVRLLGKLHETP